jgi:hypothetical protein
MTRASRSKRCAALAFAWVTAGALTAGCEPARPRGFIDYMEDAIGREATLARCNADRAGTARDLECSNARRAAAAVAAREDSARRAALDRQSEQKLAALRAALAEHAEALRVEALEAEAADRAAYEASWVPVDLLELRPDPELPRQAFLDDAADATRQP